MGADNLRSFHRWQKWRDIANLVPIVVVDRLGPSLYAAASPAGNALASARIPEHAAPALPDRKAPVWTFLHGLKSPLSSTALRALRGKRGSSGRRRRKAAQASKSIRAKSRGKKVGTRTRKRKSMAKTRQRRGGKKRAK
jgi:nicotinate-nucleotide adenylyltransferase